MIDMEVNVACFKVLPN